MDWHRSRGRVVRLKVPNDPAARTIIETARLDEPATPRAFEGIPPANASGQEIVPLTRLTDHTAIEEVARVTREVLEYKLPEVAPLGEAMYMAVSELCGNALEHGAHELGAYATVVRSSAPRRNRIASRRSDSDPFRQRLRPARHRARPEADYLSSRSTLPARDIDRLPAHHSAGMTSDRPGTFLSSLTVLRGGPSMLFALSDFGTTFSTRPLGAELRTEVEDALQAGTEVRIDLCG